MTTNNVTPSLKVGDLVRVLNSGIDRAKIVELRGPLAPGGKMVYRLRVRGKPIPSYTEVREDQLELIQTSV